LVFVLNSVNYLIEGIIQQFMSSDSQVFFVVKVFFFSAVISVFIKYFLSNFQLIDKTYLALPIVFTPTILVFITLISRALSINEKS